MKSNGIIGRVGPVAAAAALALVAAGLTACSSGSSGGSSDGTVSVWAQGTDSEIAALQATVTGFNKSQSKYTAKLRILPGASYTTTINNTPKSQLPNVLQIDGPTLASYVYNGKLTPISDLVATTTVNNATAGSIAEGTYGGKLYALAQIDSAMGLYGNKKLLDAAGVKYPTSIDTAWTADEFTAALKALAAKNPSGKSLDIGEQNGLSGEWGTYGFSPLVWSAGGNLIQGGKASGVLAPAASVKALQTFQSWKPYVDPNAAGKAFNAGRVALGWGGHWMYPDYSKSLGSNLLDLPMPNMGTGARAGAGSWTWGVGSGTKNPKAAGAFLDYLLNDQSVKAMTDADGAPPATKSVFAADKLYQPGGALALWGQQLSHACSSDRPMPGCVATYRPVTAGYPTVTAKFGGALQAIWGGANVQDALSSAAKAIDQTFADNDGYK
jgi:multiple sugar transport system substrate-binding protein